MRSFKQVSSIIVLISLVGCCSKPSNKVTVQEPPSREAEAIDVFDTAIRTDLLKEYGTPIDWGNRPIFIGIFTGTSPRVSEPPPELMHRLKSLPLRIFSIAERDTSHAFPGFGQLPEGSFCLRGDSTEGVLVGARITRWLSPIRVEVSLSQWAYLGGGGYALRLVKSGGKWIVVEQYGMWIE